MSFILITFVVLLQNHLASVLTSSPSFSSFALYAEDQLEDGPGVQERFIIKQMMYRNHEQEQMLNSVEKFLKDEKYMDALSVLQVMFDSGEDSFTENDSFSLPDSSRKKAHHFFEKLSPDLITTYEKLFGPTAKDLFTQAKNRHSASAVREIVRRFFYTEAGFQATNWLGSRALDRGHYELAREYFINLLNSPVHQKRITKEIRLKLDLCQMILESSHHELKTAQLNTSTQLNSTKRVSMKVQQVSSFEMINDTNQSSVQTALFELQSSIHSGSFFRSKMPATPPRLSPVWDQKYANSGNLLLEKLIERWKTSQYEHSSPLATVNQSIVTDNLILYRDEKGIKAFDINEGTLQWKYDCKSSLFEATKELHRRHGLTESNLSRISSYFDLQHSYVGNSIQGSMTADHHRIYVIDEMDLLAGGMNPHGNSFTSDGQNNDGRTRQFNSLIALELNPSHPEEVQPVWKLGNNTEAEGDQENPEAEPNSPVENRLEGHYFLGSPAVGDGVLYLITEYKRQLNLVALDPDRGEIQWMQGLGFVDKPIHLDRYRSTKACIPVISGGTILCPLSNGLLVAINSTTGQLMWSYYCGDDASIAEYGSWGHQQSTYGSRGFATRPHVQGNDIIYLPATSNSVHCINLTSGEQNWKIPRRDAEYIGTVTSGEFLLVGKRYCKSISLSDGSVLWSTSPGLPSGKGVSIGSSYLIPLQSGQITAIDLMTGREVGLSRKLQRNQENGSSSQSQGTGENDERWTPGNLSVADGLVISSEPGSITTFPQAGILLDETQRRLQSPEHSVSDMILAAELNLTLGRLYQARQLLVDALLQSSGEGHRSQAEQLFRDLLTLEISRGIEPKRALYQLDQLAKTPAQRGEYLMLRSKYELELPRSEEIIRTAHDLSKLELDQPLLLSSASRHLVSKESWIPHLILKASGDFHTEENTRFHLQLKSIQQEILELKEPGKMRVFITKYADFPESEVVREELAKILFERGQYQETEFLLMHNRASDDPVTAARACMYLVHLWNHVGLVEEAAILLHEMEKKYHSIQLDEYLFVRDFRDSFPEEGLLRTSYRQQIPITWEVKNVSIRETLWLENNRGIEESFEHSRGRFWTSNHQTFHILNKSYNNQGKMALIHRLSGMQVGNIEVPYRHDLPAKPQNCRSGHYIPMGSPVSMMGISLLEYASKEPLWKSKPQGDIRPHVLMRAGPSGKTFSAFQTHHTLVVVNPVNGKILWQRNDLEANSGLINDQYSGLIGDEKVLVLFGSDRQSYTVYDTLTGIILYQGQLPANDNYLRNSFGRKFFYVMNEPGQNRRVRLWDPLHNELLMDEPVDGTVFSSVTPDHKLVLGTHPDRVRILDVDSGETLVDVKLYENAFENLNYIRAFHDSGYYYLNLQRSTSANSSRKFSYFASNTYLPVVSVQGDLVAIDEKTQEMAWNIELPQRSVVHLPQYNLPFLMTISRVRDPWNSSRQSMMIEIIDRKTGETIGQKDNVLLDRFLHHCYFRETGIIELYGEKTKIELDFSQNRQKLALLPLSGNL